MVFKLLFVSDDVCSFFKNKPKKKVLKKVLTPVCFIICRQEPQKDSVGLGKGVVGKGDLSLLTK